jgi:hypothetical protein
VKPAHYGKQKETDMHRKSYLFLTVLFITFGLYGIAEAAEKEKETCFPSGRSYIEIFSVPVHMSGYNMWNKFCKSCHNRSEDSEGPFLTTEFRTRKGWDRVFKKRWPDCAKEGTWDSKTELEILNLRDYLFYNAGGLEDPRSEWNAIECPKDWREKAEND